jgi:DNA helicase-2/ATP-dependent DNA helicase PcrA
MEEVAREAACKYGGQVALSPEELLIWETYEQEKQKGNLIDFNDMLHLFARRGKEDNKWKRWVSSFYDHLLLDETQDMSRTQWAVADVLLAPGNVNVMAVGDTNQSIYGFNGASPDIFLEFCKSFRNVPTTLYKLERNHRSVPEVVGLANKVQSMMPNTIPLRMSSHRGKAGESGKTGILRAEDQRELAQEIAISIDINKRVVPPNEIAILVRSGGQVADLETALVRRRIPYLIRGAAGFLHSAEARDLLAYLRVAVNPRDYPAFKRSATTPKRGVGEVALEALRKFADEDHEGNLVTAARSRGSLLLYCGIIDKIAALMDDPSSALEEAITGSKYIQYLEKECKKDKDKLEYKISNVERLKEAVASLSNMSLEDVVFQLALAGDPDAEHEGGRVTVSTIHASKGLEFHTVYLFNVVEGVLPHKFSLNTSEEIEEERRIFYVGCTRAKDRLFIGISNQTVTAYSTTETPISRFLSEIGLS